MIWPSPARTTLTVDEARRALHLPISSDLAVDAGAIFGPPEQAATGSVTVAAPGRRGAPLRDRPR